MPLLAIVRTALEALVAYYSLKRERLEYDLIEVSEARMLALRARIEKLRDLRTEAGTQSADALQLVYQREKIKYEKYLTAL